LTLVLELATNSGRFLMRDWTASAILRLSTNNLSILRRSEVKRLTWERWDKVIMALDPSPRSVDLNFIRKRNLTLVLELATDPGRFLMTDWTASAILVKGLKSRSLSTDRLGLDEFREQEVFEGLASVSRRWYCWWGCGSTWRRIRCGLGCRRAAVAALGASIGE